MLTKIPRPTPFTFLLEFYNRPFFGAEEDAVKYGGIGMVIGHELIHGFDDQGRKFDAQGNLRDWWQPADATAYEQRGACIANEYTQIIPEAGVKQDGKLTQGEDTADNGGLHLAFVAFEDALARQGKQMDAKESDGLTPRQRFFRIVRIRVVRPGPAGAEAHSGAHQSALSSALPGQQCRFQHAGILASLQLPKGPTDGARERLSSLVEATLGTLPAESPSHEAAYRY